MFQCINVTVYEKYYCSTQIWNILPQIYFLFRMCWITTFEESLLNVLLLADVLISEVFTSLSQYWHWPQKSNANANPKHIAAVFFTIWYIVDLACEGGPRTTPSETLANQYSDPPFIGKYSKNQQQCSVILWHYLGHYNRFMTSCLPHGTVDSKGRAFLNCEGFLWWSLRYINYNKQNNKV